MKKIWDFLFSGKTAQWTALSTVAMAIFSFLLWQVSDDANNSSQASQRAFLSIAFSPRIETVVVKGEVTGYKVHEAWANNGTTPTKTAVAQFNIADSPDRPVRGFDFTRMPQAERQEYVLGPKSGWEVAPVDLSFSQVNDAASNNHVFAWGWVVYRDIFKNTPPRISEFCFEITNPKWNNVNHTKPSTFFSVTTLPCQTHNCYDDNCEDYTKLAREAK